MNKRELLQTLEKLDIFLNKRKGQCFLIDRNIRDFIVKSADLKENESVLEIGPGLGVLSMALVKTTHTLFLIEKDRKMVSYLKTLFEKEIKEKKISLIEGDALKEKWPLVNKIVSNIPYQISAPLVFRILENWNYESVILMVQKEFAERMYARPGTRAYSRLSAAISLQFQVTPLKQVPPSCFFPQPKVFSVIVKITKNDQISIEKREFQAYLSFLKGVFPYKNKTLENALKFFRKTTPSLFDNEISPKDAFNSLIPEEILKKRVKDLSSLELFSVMKGIKFQHYSQTNNKKEMNHNG